MLRSDRGIGLIEVVIAMFLMTVGILAIMALQAPAWRTAARADYLGRAAGILAKELESCSAIIMNPCNNQYLGSNLPTVIDASVTVPTRDVFASGQNAAITGVNSGEATFRVQTVITAIGANFWRVTVTVTWPPLNSTGITESTQVTRQEKFRFPAGCV